MNEERLRQVVREEVVRVLGDYSKMPLEVEEAIKRRIGGLVLSTSAKSATSENQAVSESGSDSYSVLAPPDAFAQITVSGATIYIPYYT